MRAWTIQQVAASVYDEAFTILDNEPDISGETAGKVANYAAQAAESALKAIDDQYGPLTTYFATTLTGRLVGAPPSFEEAEQIARVAGEDVVIWTGMPDAKGQYRRHVIAVVRASE